MFKAFLASWALFGALAASQPSNASCYGYAGPGGPCSMGPGGGLPWVPIVGVVSLVFNPPRSGVSDSGYPKKPHSLGRVSFRGFVLPECSCAEELGLAVSS